MHYSLFEHSMEGKNKLLRKTYNLKAEISALRGMSEETQQRRKHEIQSSSTATKQRQQRHTGNTN